MMARSEICGALTAIAISAWVLIAVEGAAAAERNSIPLPASLKSFIEDAPRPLSLTLKTRDGSATHYVIDVDEQGEGTLTYHEPGDGTGHLPSEPLAVEGFDGGYKLGTTKLARERLKERVAQLWRELFTSTNRLMSIDLKINHGDDAHLQAAPVIKKTRVGDLFGTAPTPGSVVSILEKHEPRGETPFWQETRYHMEDAAWSSRSAAMSKLASRGRKVRRWQPIEEFRDEAETDPSDWMRTIGEFLKVLKKAPRGVILTTPGPIRFGDTYEIRVDEAGRGKAQVFDVSGERPLPVFAWSFRLAVKPAATIPKLADELYESLTRLFDVSGIKLELDSGVEVEAGALYREDLEKMVHFTKHGSSKNGWTWNHYDHDGRNLLHTHHGMDVRSVVEEERQFGRNNKRRRR